MDKVKYRVINKSDNKVMTFSMANDVALQLLSRRLDNYIVIKSSHYDRVVQLIDYEFNAIVFAVENA
jgi:hypothetical protein